MFLLRILLDPARAGIIANTDLLFITAEAARPAHVGRVRVVHVHLISMASPVDPKRSQDGLMKS